MASEILEANAEGTNTGWSLHAGANKVVAVQSPDDDDTSAVKSPTFGTFQSYYVDALSGAAAVIDQVDVRWRARDNSGAGAGTETAKGAARVGAGVWTGADRTMAADSAYTTWNETDLNPGGWNVSDFDGATAEVELRKSNTGGSTCIATSIRMTVTYTPAAGGYKWLLNCWIPPLVAVASHGLNLSEIARFFASFKCRPSRPEELAMIRDHMLVRPRFA